LHYFLHTVIANEIVLLCACPVKRSRALGCRAAEVIGGSLAIHCPDQRFWTKPYRQLRTGKFIALPNSVPAFQGM